MKIRLAVIIAPLLILAGLFVYDLVFHNRPEMISDIISFIFIVVFNYFFWREPKREKKNKK